MLNRLVRFALGVANMPDATVDDLEKSLPGFKDLAADFRLLQPILAKAEPHIEALQPLLDQALPIIKMAWPDIVSVTPTTEELIDFADKS